MIRTRTAPLAAFLLALVLTACGAPESEPSAPSQTSGQPPAETDAVPEAPPAATGCAAASDCAACLVIEGCNWTAGICASECHMDTYCVGPGNPSAPTCTHNVVILGEWHQDHAASDNDVMVFVPVSVELGMARFRRQMTFLDGTEDSPPAFETNVLSPDDAHYAAEGTWSVEGDRLTVRYQARGGSEQTVEQYDIVESSHLQLRLRSVTP